MSDSKLRAFVEATRTTFTGMLQVDAQPAYIERGRGVKTGYDVSGIIGLSNLGGATSPDDGSLVLSFPEAVARRAVGRILGLGELPTLDQDVADGIGELVNVISGRAKAFLAEAGVRECRTTLPNVILGSQHRVFHQRNVERFEAAFTSEIGTFLLQVLLLSPIEETTARIPARRHR